MKFSNAITTNSNFSNRNNWLGFSLAPNMEMSSLDSSHHHHPLPYYSSSAPTLTSSTYFHSLPDIDSSTNWYAHHPNADYTSAMPLNSDGSLCIMGATRSSVSQVESAPAPKLEDFFGDGTIGTHQTDANESRQAMALSLDSMYYHQTGVQEANTNLHFLHTIQDGTRPHQIEFQHYPIFYFSYRTHDPFHETQEGKMKETNVETCNIQLPASSMGDDDYYELKNCPTDHVGYGDLQALTLSMSSASKSANYSCFQRVPHPVKEPVALDSNKRGADKVNQKQIVHRKSLDTFGQRTSQYRGVTRHRWTGRYEAHLWDSNCKKEGQSRKGRQVYLGGYDVEEKAARAYDLAALKYWGSSTHINFSVENYQQELEAMKSMSRQEYVAHLRRKSSGFSRGASIYRGVTRHHQHGRWQARIGRVAGNKDLYLGTFSIQEEAAEAYDIAAIKFRGISAVTNFDITKYNVERIMESSTLLPSELARRKKEPAPISMDASGQNHLNVGCPITALPRNQIDYPINLHQMPQHPAAFQKPQQISESDKMTNYVSNASSQVTSVGSSREGTPDRSNISLPMVCGMHTMISSKFLGSPKQVMYQIPEFEWTDAPCP